MPNRRWRVRVSKLGAENVLYEGEVDAANWMGAMRAAREGMSERASVPPGVSCSIDTDGTATVLDPGSRRRFVLAPGATSAVAAAPAKADAPPPPVREPAPAPALPTGAQAAQAPVAQAAPVAAAEAAPEPPTKRKKFQTVGFMPEHLVERPVAVQGTGPAIAPASTPASTPASAPASDPPRAETRAEPAQPAVAAVATAAPGAVVPTKKKKFETVAFAPGAQHASGMVAVVGNTAAATASPASTPAPRTSLAPGSSIELSLLFERSEDPSRDNPLCYRERAFLLPKSATVLDAEAALRWKLADLQKELEGRARGKLINLAVFDHRWKDVPERPPLITLQWRDWRNEVIVDYPAAARLSSVPAPSVGPHDDRLSEVFEALEGLVQRATAADALDFAVGLLSELVPSAAIAGCLYDINTDELRFVALTGFGASAMQGRAVARAGGLFGQAARVEQHATVFNDVLVQPAFNPEVDSRPGLDAHNVLLCPLVHERQLVGMLQLVNRSELSMFTAEDANVVSYLAERLAERIHIVRRRSHPPTAAR